MRNINVEAVLIWTFKGSFLLVNRGSSVIPFPKRKGSIQTPGKKKL
jgi:hypothetical protein